MGKRVIVSENVLRSLLMEMARERMALNEISTADAWNKFYKDKVPAHIWNTLMDGTTKMTPFHKLILDYITGGKIIEENIPALVNAASAVWNKSDLSRQYVVNAVNANFSGLKPNRILAFLDTIKDIKRFTENEYIDNGFIGLYENDKIRITATLCYSANKKHFGDSHWCTASDINGRYNGWKMFSRYSVESDCSLIQFIDKQNRQNTVQASFNEDGDTDTICDFMDDSWSDDKFNDFLRDHGIARFELWDFINFAELVKETKALSEEESYYWEIRTEDSTNKGIKAIEKVVNSESFNNQMIETIKWVFEHQFDNPEWSPFAVTPANLYSGNRYVVSVNIKHYEIDKTENLFGANAAGVLYRLYEEGDSRLNGKIGWAFLVDSTDMKDVKILNRYNGYFYTNFGNVVVLSAYDGPGENPCYNPLINAIDGSIIFDGYLDGEPMKIRVEKYGEKTVLLIGDWEFNARRGWQYRQRAVFVPGTLEFYKEDKLVDR